MNSRDIFSADQDRYRILFVEDDRDQVELCKNIFFEHNISADIANDSNRAVQLAMFNAYDAILLDYNVHGSMSNDLIKGLKRLNIEAPLLMLTGKDPSSITVEAIKSIFYGAYAHLDKCPGYHEKIPHFISSNVNRFRMQKLREQMKDDVKRFEYTVENISEYVVMTDPSGTITYANGSFNDRYGYLKGDVIGRDISVIMDPDDVKDKLQRVMLNNNPRGWSGELTTVTRQGEKIESLMTIMAIRNDTGSILSYVILSRDITERKRAEKELAKSRDFYLTLFEGFPAMIWRSGVDGKYDYFNRSWLDFTGKSLESQAGFGWAKSIYHEDIKARIDTYVEAFRLRRPFEMEYRLLRHDGEYRWVIDMGRPFFDQDGKFAGYIGSCYDITERKEAERALKESEERFRYMSFHDNLTGLYNRAFFEMTMNSLNEEGFDVLSIICIDIDGLKMINDAFGHKAGDELLVAASNILTQAFMDIDIISRVGGDEICVIMPDADEALASARKEEIISLLKKYNDKSPHLPISMSIGIASSSEGVSNKIYDIYQRADDDMYKYKLSQSDSPRSNIVDLLLAALAERDFIAHGHSERMSMMAERMADAIGLPDVQKRDLILLAKVHDIGKVGVSDKILLKPGKLTDDEYEQMKKHSWIGYNIANRSRELSHIASLILHHHECWDGAGYPDGLKGENIPLVCRIISIIDSYDAMTSKRPYRDAMSKKEAIEELKRCSGTQFEPSLVDEFIELVENQIMEHVSPASKNRKKKTMIKY
ncbi:hypothetical protein CUJ83_01670 [Methanocella sp. CWC-04]|uniref:PAS domain S-box-containing protein/diguanylate cyclase (GGDEF) domain-containing protein n=1 Tax=Methanooceanicella nereidis TaxID=2052831 RepID=A0AAP2RA17_9EURY|nr:PAS domain S-box protein [Methanocella sp. CWC-04]MCD1293703.1 hypothetical protein [Methanocella sp. CWC-04]